jgi:chromosome partitioning protein
MIVAVGNTKGGVGKSTAAVQIAIALARKNRRVLIINGDRQKSSLYAIAARKAAGVLPEVWCILSPEGDDLEQLLNEQKHQFDDVVLDVGGRDTSAFRAALIASELLYVPTQPRAFEDWSLEDLTALLDQATETRQTHQLPPLRVMAGLNLADYGDLAADNEDAKKSLMALPQVQFIDAPLRRRKAFWYSAARGLCVAESKPVDHKAVDELNTLMSMLFDI